MEAMDRLTEEHTGSQMLEFLHMVCSVNLFHLINPDINLLGLVFVLSAAGISDEYYGFYLAWSTAENSVEAV